MFVCGNTSALPQVSGSRNIIALSVEPGRCEISFSLQVILANSLLHVLRIFQKHLLPRSLSQVVSKVLFWPTLPITISRRLGSWTTQVDDTVMIGGVPYLGYPEKLAKENVRGVVNLCDEYRGPLGAYKRLGIDQLYVPTVDHFEPDAESLKSAVSFIQEHESQGNKGTYIEVHAVGPI